MENREQNKFLSQGRTDRDSMEKNVKKLVLDLSNPDEDLRALSAMTLLKLDIADQRSRSQVVKALMKATKDKNISVRFFSRRAIDKQKAFGLDSSTDSEVLPINVALESEDFEQRLDAVIRISRERKVEYKEKLLQMLQVEKNDFVKATLISALKLFLDKSQASILSKFLQDSDNRVRSNTIEALESLKADEAIPNLFPCLDDHDNRIRAVAAKALQSFGEEKVFAVLKRMLTSKEEWMRVSAIYSLSHIQSAESIKLLMDASKTAGQVEIRLKAIVALANYNDSSSYGLLKRLSSSREEPFKTVAEKSMRLFEEKFGANPPTTTLIEEEKPEKAVQENASGPQAVQTESDFRSTVSKFFRKGKQEEVGLSSKAQINFALTDLENEQGELMKEAGRILFVLYQKGDLTNPELLTIGHEILRMNFFIQKYTEEEEKRASEDKGGFFSQLKAFFSASSTPKSSPASQIEKFTQRRETLFQKLGKTTFFKMKVDEFKSLELDGYYHAFQKLEEKIQKEKGNQS